MQDDASAPTYYTHMATPIGRLLIAGDARALQRVVFPSPAQDACIAPQWRRDAGPLTAAMTQLDAYFAGDGTGFDLALVAAGTPFRQRVWAALRTIPYAATISYGELARRIGQPTASRAVGAANGANPLPIIVPCHRVIGSSGDLTGFGGGLPIKRWLLDHERRFAPAPA